MLPTLVTIHVADPGVRLSRVTPHGEEVIEKVDEVTAMLAVRLWASLSQAEPTGHVDPIARMTHTERRLEESLLRIEGEIHSLQQRAATLENRWEANHPESKPELLRRIVAAEEEVAALREKQGKVEKRLATMPTPRRTEQ